MDYFDYNVYQTYIKDTSLDNHQHQDYLKNRKLMYINGKEYECIETKQYNDGYPIPMDKIGNIFRTNTLENDGISLYDLLNKGHQFRHRSLIEFFDKTKGNSIQASKIWLGSKECAFTDYSSTNSSTGELPSANYYEGIDKFLINTGQNRAFAGLLIGAKEYRVENISYYRPKGITKSEVKGHIIDNLEKNKQGIFKWLTKWIIGK